MEISRLKLKKEAPWPVPPYFLCHWVQIFNLLFRLVVSDWNFSLFFCVSLSFQAPLPSPGPSYLQPTLPLRPTCSLSDRAPTFLSNSTLHSKTSLTLFLLCSIIHFPSVVSSAMSHHPSVIIKCHLNIFLSSWRWNLHLCFLATESEISW